VSRTTTDRTSTVSSPSTTTRPASTGSSQVTTGTTSGRSGGATPRGTTGSTVTNGSKPNSSSGTSAGTVTRRSDSGSHVGTSSSNIDRNSNRPAPDISGHNQTGKPNNGGKPGGRPNGKPDGNGKPNGKPDGNGKPNGKPDGNGRPGHGGGHGHGGGNHGYGGSHNNHFDYTGHHYHNEFSWNHTHHNWSRPLPPPARPYRPAPLVWYRPVIPTGWYPYASAPIIDRILGLNFGTLFDISLDYLYYNGYEIDGYADNIIYLRNVRLLNYLWDDVMLCYDSYNQLVNAQFVFQTSYYDRYRYERIYRSLCRVYGNPFTNDHGALSWYGGKNTGWVTLAMHDNLGHYYTTLSIGY